MNGVNFVPLGGMGNVTQNMYVYSYQDEILIVDCGIGFPDQYMPGVDILLPDVSHIHQQLDAGKRIVGMILTHGHDDHIGALPYLLPDLPEFPIFASPLTAGFARNRMKEVDIDRPITVVSNSEVFKVSEHFSAQAFAVTHSVPDTRHYAIRTPEGIIYHGSDFKLDPSPVGGEQSDLAGIGELAKENVLCMLIDSLRVERLEWTPSESLIGPVLDKEMASTTGKFIVTLMSSHIHRIQQVVDAAQEYGRKVVFIGRSVEQNTEVAQELGELRIPKGMQIDKRDIGDYKAKELCLIIAGSQGQEGSSLMRAVSGEHPIVMIHQEDKVVFSADVIPGNEIPYFSAIDELSRNGVQVIYPSIEPGVHHSGHAGAAEQKELLGLVKPKLVMPIGGADRHRALFVDRVAEPLGYTRGQVLIPLTGEVLTFSQDSVRVSDKISITPRTVDGLGIGDVGPVVLSDRRALSEAGIIVLVIPRRNGQLDIKRMEVVSRGFVFMKEADEVIQFIKQTVGQIVHESQDRIKDEELRRQIDKRLGRKLYKTIKREPMIVPVILDI
jgi:ribonuclease J